MRHIFFGSSTAANAYTLALDCGVYTLTGNAVGLTVQRKLTADAGTYSLTGNDLTLTYAPSGDYTLGLDAGVYTLTGNAVTLTYTPVAEESTGGLAGGFGVDVGRELRRKQLEDEDEILLAVIKSWLKAA